MWKKPWTMFLIEPETFFYYWSISLTFVDGKEKSLYFNVQTHIQARKFNKKITIIFVSLSMNNNRTGLVYFILFWIMIIYKSTIERWTYLLFPVGHHRFNVRSSLYNIKLRTSSNISSLMAVWMNRGPPCIEKLLPLDCNPIILE